VIEALSHIICPKCAYSKPVFTSEAVLHICPSCQAIFGENDKHGAWKLEKEFAHFASELPLGIQLKHNDLIYTVTGKLVNYEENDRKAIWSEYALTNPEAENIYLSCWNGHWSLVECIDDFENKWKPADQRKDLQLDDISYTYFHKYRIRIAYAEGEFNFDVFEDDKQDAFEYINPPLTIIVEYKKGAKKIQAFKSVYLFKGELKKKLSDRVSLENSSGIAGNQPFYLNLNPPTFLRGSVVLFFVMLLLQLLLPYISPAVLITRADYGLISQDSSRVYNFDSFLVPYDYALMNVTMRSSSLNNDWVAAEMTLVNDATAEERSFSMETERYSGFTDGESWSEGDYEAKGNINQVRKGKYHFEISPVHQMGSAPKDISIKAEVFKGSWSVFWVFTSLLLVFNIVIGIVHDYFEHSKWGEDYDTFDFLYN